MIRKNFSWYILILVGLALPTAATVRAAVEDFVVIVLPDTQYYSQSYPANFIAQTQWIVDNRTALNIVYVAHEGDIVNTASSVPQWENADTAMSLLENPITTGLPEGIPYGVVPGNHDESPLYNDYFGVDRFCTAYPAGCKSYYGEGYPAGGNNDSNYTLFSASGMDFIAVNLDYISPAAGLLTWADQVLQDHSDHRAIVVSHSILGYPPGGSSISPFTSWGQQIYNALRNNPNLFIMFCGHNHTEGRRTDTYGDNTVYSLLADYQDLPNGGDGWLRIMTFSPANDVITVTTYSPVLDAYGTDTIMGVNTTSAPFTLVYDMDSAEKADTTTTLNSAPNPSLLGQSVTFTAIVTSTDGTPTGNVTFYDDGVPLGTEVLNGSGVATYVTSAFAPGTHPITATYNGDADFYASASGEVNQMVINFPPVAAADGYTMTFNTSLVVAAPGVLVNDTDVESNPLTAVLDTDVSVGTLDLHTDGSFVYTPPANYAGVVTFTYHANDGYADSNVVQVTIAVRSIYYFPLIMRQ